MALQETKPVLGMMSEHKHSKMNQCGNVKASGLFPSLVLFLARQFPRCSWPPVRFTASFLQRPRPVEELYIDIPSSASGLLGVAWVDLYRAERYEHLEHSIYCLFSQGENSFHIDMVEKFFRNARGAATPGNSIWIGGFTSKEIRVPSNWRRIDLRLFQAIHSTLAVGVFASPFQELSDAVHEAVTHKAQSRHELKILSGHIFRPIFSTVGPKTVWWERTEETVRPALKNLQKFVINNIGSGILTDAKYPMMIPCWYQSSGTEGTSRENEKLSDILCGGSHLSWKVDWMTVVKQDSSRSPQRKVFDDYSVLLDLDLLQKSVQMDMYGNDIFHTAVIELEEQLPGLLILLAVARHVERILHKVRTIMESVRYNAFSRSYFKRIPLNFEEVLRELIAIQLLEADARNLEEEFAEAYPIINNKYGLTAFTPTEREGNYASEPHSGALSDNIHFLMDRASKVIEHLRSITEAMSRHSLEMQSRTENRSLLGLTVALLALTSVEFWYPSNLLRSYERTWIIAGVVSIWGLAVLSSRFRLNPVQRIRQLLNFLRQRIRSIW